MAQTDKVLAYLRGGKTITSMEAFGKFHITRLSRVIFDLKKKGHDIVTIRMDATDEDGRPYQYAKYMLRVEEE